MESLNKESDLLKSLNISDSFAPRLWINEYFSELINKLDILTETLLIEIQNDPDAIKKSNEKRDKLLEKINECEKIDLKEYEQFPDENKFYLKDLYETVLKAIKKKCQDSEGSFQNEEKSLFMEEYFRNESKIENQLHALLTDIFQRFCFFVKETDFTNSLENSAKGVKCLYVTDFYLGQETIK